MPPLWLEVVSMISLVLAGLSALLIVVDMLRGHPQTMWIMDVVWPVTALYFGPIAVWAYRVMGRPQARNMGKKEGQQDKSRHDTERQLDEQSKAKKDPFWEITFRGVTHCGSGCTLGDIIAEWLVFFFGFSIASLTLWPSYILDYAFAYLLGILFQYFTIAPMRGLSVGPGIWAAIKADTLSLTAFEVGLFAWMALTSLVFFHPELRPDNPVFWFMMQIGMIIGFATSYPMNWFAIKKGFKEAM